MILSMRKKNFFFFSSKLSKLLKSGLYSRNLFSAINTWAMSVFRCDAEILGLTEAELQEVDKHTQKEPSSTRGCKSDANRSDVKRSKGGRGLISVEGVMHYEIHS